MHDIQCEHLQVSKQKLLIVTALWPLSVLRIFFSVNNIFLNRKIEQNIWICLKRYHSDY